MDYQNHLNEALNGIFFKGLKSHVEKSSQNKWGDNWKENIREYSDNFRPPLDFDKNSNPIWDISKLIRIFTINELREVFGIENPKQKNIAFVIRDTRNELAHNIPISLENLLSAIYGMKFIASIFDDDKCLNDLNKISEKFIFKSKDDNDEIEINKGPNNINKPLKPIPVDATDIDELPIDWKNRSVGPLKLIEVSEKSRGQKKAIILRFDGIDIDVGCNFQDDYDERLNKCKNLINQNVVVNWVGDKFTFEKGWFSDINSFFKTSNDKGESVSSYKIENEESLFLIEKVEKVPGSYFKDVFWRNPMWLIKTNKGEFINSVKDISENEIIPGSTVKGRIHVSKGYKWLNIEKTK